MQSMGTRKKERNIKNTKGENRMNIQADGVATDGKNVAKLYRLMDCTVDPKIIAEEVYKGNAESIIKALSKDDTEKLPAKRHCQACNALIDLKSGQKKLHCDGSKCRQATFMLKKQVRETGEWIDGIFHFSHKGQVKGGTVQPLGDSYMISYLGETVKIEIMQKKNYLNRKPTKCVDCRDLDDNRVVCRLSDEKNSKLHLGKVVSIMQAYG